MRSLFLVTGTNEVLKYMDSLANLKYGPCEAMPYDAPGLGDEILYGRVKEWNPDLIVYIGSRWGKQPSISTLARMNTNIAPSVHICSDAADPPWHDLIREYHTCGAFSVQVAIDGSHKWPTADSNMTALTPVDPALFPKTLLPHSERTIECGYAGNAGGGPASKRTVLLGELLRHRVLDLRIRSNLPYTYEAFCVYLTKLRMSLNIAFTGTESTMHVKGRVLESALAGAMLLETKGSPTSYWFRPGVDYLEYGSVAEALDLIQHIDTAASQAVADSLRRRVLSEHSPEAFWQRIFERIGINSSDDKYAYG